MREVAIQQQQELAITQQAEAQQRGDRAMPQHENVIGRGVAIHQEIALQQHQELAIRQRVVRHEVGRPNG